MNNGSNNLMAFNISNPAAPILSATIATGAVPNFVAVAGTHAFVANASSTLQVFNLFCPNTITMDPGTGEIASQPSAWAFPRGPSRQYQPGQRGHRHLRSRQQVGCGRRNGRRGHLLRHHGRTHERSHH
ncbi:MAG: hypothetical protein IPN38_19210 [Flavobacteriales bacterium]|nr:hypothetical protein [Flavobacteriales bacterium]